MFLIFSQALVVNLLRIFNTAMLYMPTENIEAWQISFFFLCVHSHDHSYKNSALKS